MAIKIFIDQGHNPSGPNTGAEGNGLVEQDITYAVGQYLAELLRADPQFEVRLSRNAPDEILGTSNATSLAARVQAANDWPADYFISIHCNANENPAINGTEVYVYQEGTRLTGLRSTCCAASSAAPAHATTAFASVRAFTFCGAQKCRPFSWSWPTLRTPRTRGGSKPTPSASRRAS